MSGGISQNDIDPSISKQVKSSTNNRKVSHPSETCGSHPVKSNHMDKFIACESKSTFHFNLPKEKLCKCHEHTYEKTRRKALRKLKQGQVEINETLLVLFVIVIILIIGMFLYFRFSLAHVKTIAGELSEQESTILLASALALQEIRCEEKDCADTSKFLPFAALTQHDQYYSDLLGFKKIVFEQVYPAVEGHECTLSLYSQDTYPQNCRLWVVYDHHPGSIKQRTLVSTFVSLYFPEINEYRIGRLEVTTYA